MKMNTGGMLSKCPHCHGTGLDPEIPNYDNPHNSSPTVGQRDVVYCEVVNGTNEKIAMVPSLRNLCWKIDRDVWAKVESGEATTSWGREQTGLLILDFLKEMDSINRQQIEKSAKDLNECQIFLSNVKPKIVEAIEKKIQEEITSMKFQDERFYISGLKEAIEIVKGS